MAPILGYWEIRGFGEVIHIMLHYCDVKYTRKVYPFGKNLKDLADLRKHWLADKYNLGLDFPNLPYFIDGDLKMTQTFAILRYLARKYDLDAKDESEMAQIDVIEQQIQDMRAKTRAAAYSFCFDEDIKRYQEFLIKFLDSIDAYLADRQWLVGNRLTYVDFVCFDTLDWSRLCTPDIFKKYPKLENYLKRFREIPKVKEYLESDEFVEWPLSAPIGKFGHYNPPDEIKHKYPNY